MNDTTIEPNACVDRCVLDKEIVIGANAQVGVGDETPPNRTEPNNIHAGITIVGKRAHVPDGTVIGRNCRIDSEVRADDFERREVPSGETISRRKAQSRF